MAIALDTSADGGLVNASSLTWSHTCTGTNLILFVACFAEDTDNVTGVTYNTIALTQIAKIHISRFVYLYALTAPATGTHDVVVSISGGPDVIAGMSASYTGVKQSGQPEVSTTNTGVNVTSLTTSLTTSTNNSWTILATKNDSGTATAGTGSTTRQSAGNGLSIFDSNAAITPAGSTSMQMVPPAQTDCVSIMAAFAPLGTKFVLIPGR